MNLFMVMSSRQAHAQGYIDSKHVDVLLTDNFACKHTKALFNPQILFPNVVWLKNIRVLGGWYLHLHNIQSKSNCSYHILPHPNNTNLVF